MPALVYNLVIDQGSDFTITIPVLNSNNQAVDVDTWAIAGQIRRDALSAFVLQELDVTTSGTDVTVHIPAAASSSWPFAAAHYDVELTSPSGAVTRFMEGLVVVRPEITR